MNNRPQINKNIFRLDEKRTRDLELDGKKRAIRTLDPVTIDPLYRARLKKIGNSQNWIPPNDLKTEVYKFGKRLIML